MGYACPVCGVPQMDAGHLANHLAFTALLGDEDHEGWLDEHAPGWGDAGEDALAARIVEHAPEREFPQMFEDTVGASEHDDPEERSGALFEGGRVRDFEPAGRAPDPEVERVVAEARELTRRRRAETGSRSDEDGPGEEDRSDAVDDGEREADDEGPAGDADGNE